MYNNAIKVDPEVWGKTGNCQVDGLLIRLLF